LRCFWVTGGYPNSRRYPADIAPRQTAVTLSPTPEAADRRYPSTSLHQQAQLAQATRVFVAFVATPLVHVFEQL
jgi:hypothetical protein